MNIGLALKILIGGIVLASLYISYTYAIKDDIPKDMSGLVYFVPLMFIVLLTVGGFFFGFIVDLRNPELSSTLKTIEVCVAVLVFAGFLWFFRQIT